MNLHEYQGKSILQGYGVSVPFGIVASSPDQAFEAAKNIQKQTGSDKWAVKAQIHAGGRGKERLPVPPLARMYRALERRHFDLAERLSLLRHFLPKRSSANAVGY